MIALKLSYTYPYFEKLTGIIPVSASLTILLFFTVAMIINTPLIRAVAGLGKSKKQLDSYPIATVVTIIVLLGGISYFFFNENRNVLSLQKLHSVHFPSPWRSSSPNVNVVGTPR